MKNLLRILGDLVLIVVTTGWRGSAVADADSNLGFENYAVKSMFKGKAVRVVFPSSHEREYRTRFQEAAREKANFAGDTHLFAIGCGTDCSLFGIQNLRTGRAYLGFPVFSLELYYHRALTEAEFDAMPKDKSSPNRIDFHANSRLLYIRGCRDEEFADCGTFRYEWNGRELRLLSENKLPKPAPRQHD